MKKTLLAGLAVGVMMLGMSGVASAAIIDFNSNPDMTYWVTPITSNGFTFSDITGEGSLGTASILDHVGSVNNGTVHLMDWNNYAANDAVSVVKMEASDGSSFDLSSFDFTSGYLNGSYKATQLAVTGFNEYGVAIANAVFLSDSYNESSFTTLSLANIFQGLSYVTFEALGGNNRVGYDNIVANQPVPEPATMLLMGTGLAGLIGARRKKKA